MTVRQTLLAMVVATFSLTTQVLAQPAPSPSVAATTPASGSASLTHSALKATTFKSGSTATNLALLSYAAGGVVGGAALTVFMLGSSWVIYTANDYIWDSYSPPPMKQSESSHSMQPPMSGATRASSLPTSR